LSKLAVSNLSYLVYLFAELLNLFKTKQQNRTNNVLKFDSLEKKVSEYLRIIKIGGLPQRGSKEASIKIFILRFLSYLIPNIKE